MPLPESGGAFGPYGAFEGEGAGYDLSQGWSDRLERHFRTDLSEAEKAGYTNPDGASFGYPYQVVEKFLSEPGSRIRGAQGLRVQPFAIHEPPKFYRTEKGFDDLSSIVCLTDRIWAVDESVKAIIEDLEPGKHQLFPLEIRMPRGRVYPVCYYTLAVGQWHSSFEYGGSSRDSAKVDGLNVVVDWRKKGVEGLAFRAEEFGDSAMWRERQFGPNLMCYSDLFAERLLQSHLKLPKFWKMRTV